MRYQSQKDPKWAKEKLGTSSTTIGANGCFLTALSNLADMTPSEANKKLIKGGGYSNGNMMNSDKAKTILGLEYLGRVSPMTPPYICVAETNHYKKLGVPQHFFNIRPDGKIVDPLDLKPEWKKNKYNIVSLRLFKAKTEKLTEEPEEKTSFGIDLSHHNKVLDWDKVKADFIYIKATQGTTFLDSKFKEYRDAVRKKGIKLGFYHFAGKMNDAGQIIPQDPIKEADWFVSNLDLKENEDLILDWEVEHKDPVSWCRIFIERVKEQTGKTCIFYTNEARALKYPFPKEWVWWIAKYGTNDGTKQTEPRCQWNIWQYTSRGKVAGIEGFVDLNIKQNEPTITTEDKKDIIPVGEPETPIIGEVKEEETSAPVEAEEITTNENNMEQKKYAFDKETLRKIGKGMLIASAGAILTYITQLGLDYGVYTPVATAVLAILVNVVNEYRKGK